MRSEADVAAVLAVELRHEGLVRVTDEQDGGIEGLDLLLAALVCLDADGPPAAPVVPLTFKPFPWGAGVGGGGHMAGERWGGSGGKKKPTPPPAGPLRESHTFTCECLHSLMCLLSTYYVRGTGMGTRNKMICKVSG